MVDRCLFAARLRLFCLFFSFLQKKTEHMSDPVHEEGEVETPEGRLSQLETLAEIIEENVKQSQSHAGEKIVLFLGPTGSGKSLTIAWLCGGQVEENPETGHCSHNLGDEAFKVGHTKNSQTRLLEFQAFPEEAELEGLWACDPPGFGDTNGVFVDVANFVSIKTCISKAKGVVPIVLWEKGCFEALKGAGFKLLIPLMADLLPLSNEQLKQSVLVWISKVDKSMKKKKLRIAYNKLAEDINQSIDFFNKGDDLSARCREFSKYIRTEFEPILSSGPDPLPFEVTANSNARVVFPITDEEEEVQADDVQEYYDLIRRVQQLAPEMFDFNLPTTMANDFSIVLHQSSRDGRTWFQSESFEPIGRLLKVLHVIRNNLPEQAEPILREVQGILFDFAYQKQTETTDQLTDMFNNLSSSPTTLSNYFSFRKKLQNIFDTVSLYDDRIPDPTELDLNFLNPLAHAHANFERLESFEEENRTGDLEWTELKRSLEFFRFLEDWAEDNYEIFWEPYHPRMSVKIQHRIAYLSVPINRDTIYHTEDIARTGYLMWSASQFFDPSLKKPYFKEELRRFCEEISSLLSQLSKDFIERMEESQKAIEEYSSGPLPSLEFMTAPNLGIYGIFESLIRSERLKRVLNQAELLEHKKGIDEKMQEYCSFLLEKSLKYTENQDFELLKLPLKSVYELTRLKMTPEEINLGVEELLARIRDIVNQSVQKLHLVIKEIGERESITKTIVESIKVLRGGMWMDRYTQSSILPSLRSSYEFLLDFVCSLKDQLQHSFRARCFTEIEMIHSKIEHVRLLCPLDPGENHEQVENEVVDFPILLHAKEITEIWESGMTEYLKESEQLLKFKFWTYPSDELEQTPISVVEDPASLSLQHPRPLPVPSPSPSPSFTENDSSLLNRKEGEIMVAKDEKNKSKKEKKRKRDREKSDVEMKGKESEKKGKKSERKGKESEKSKKKKEKKEKDRKKKEEQEGSGEVATSLASASSPISSSSISSPPNTSRNASKSKSERRGSLSSSRSKRNSKKRNSSFLEMGAQLLGLGQNNDSSELSLSSDIPQDEPLRKGRKEGASKEPAPTPLQECARLPSDKQEFSPVAPIHPKRPSTSSYCWTKDKKFNLGHLLVRPLQTRRWGELNYFSQSSPSDRPDWERVCRDLDVRIVTLQQEMENIIMIARSDGDFRFINKLLTEVKKGVMVYEKEPRPLTQSREDFSYDYLLSVLQDKITEMIEAIEKKYDRDLANLNEEVENLKNARHVIAHYAAIEDKINEAKSKLREKEKLNEEKGLHLLLEEKYSEVESSYDGLSDKMKKHVDDGFKEQLKKFSSSVSTQLQHLREMHPLDKSAGPTLSDLAKALASLKKADECFLGRKIPVTELSVLENNCSDLFDENALECALVIDRFDFRKILGYLVERQILKGYLPNFYRENPDFEVKIRYFTHPTENNGFKRNFVDPHFDYEALSIPSCSFSQKSRKVQPGYSSFHQGILNSLRIERCQMLSQFYNKLHSQSLEAKYNQFNFEEFQKILRSEFDIYVQTLCGALRYDSGSHPKSVEKFIATLVNNFKLLLPPEFYNLFLHTLSRKKVVEFWEKKLEELLDEFENLLHLKEFQQVKATLKSLDSASSQLYRERTRDFLLKHIDLLMYNSEIQMPNIESWGYISAMHRSGLSFGLIDRIFTRIKPAFTPIADKILQVIKNQKSAKIKNSEIEFWVAVVTSFDEFQSSEKKVLPAMAKISQDFYDQFKRADQEQNFHEIGQVGTSIISFPLWRLVEPPFPRNFDFISPQEVEDRIEEIMKNLKSQIEAAKSTKDFEKVSTLLDQERDLRQMFGPQGSSSSISNGSIKVVQEDFSLNAEREEWKKKIMDAKIAWVERGDPKVIRELLLDLSAAEVILVKCGLEAEFSSLKKLFLDYIDNLEKEFLNGTKNHERILLDLRKHGEEFAFVEKQALKAISTCLESVSQEILAQIGENFRRGDDGTGHRIISENPQFKALKDRQLNNHVAKLGENEALGKFRIVNYTSTRGKLGWSSWTNKPSASLGPKQFPGDGLSDETKSEFKSMYSTFQKFYREHWEKPEEIHGLIPEARKLAKKLNITSKRNSLQISKDDLFETLPQLLAVLFAYWTLTLSDMDPNNLDEASIRKPHCIQVFSIFQFFTGNQKDFLRNSMIQIGTGEGKSITIGMTALIFGLLDIQCDCVCFSPILSQRDYQDFEPFFKAFGVDHLIFYGTIDDLCNRIINEEGNVRDLVSHFLEGKQFQVKKKNKNPKVLLIDEVDVFFSETFFGQTYQPIALLRNQETFDVLRYVWGNHHKASFNVLEVFNLAAFKKLVKEYPKFEEIFRTQVRLMTAEVKRFKDVPYHFKTERGIVKIGYKHHGDISTSLYHGHRTNFAYFHEWLQTKKVLESTVRDNVGFLITAGQYSYTEIPGSYSLIAGATGTLQTLTDRQLDLLASYNIHDLAFAPSVHGDKQSVFKEDGDFKLTFSLSDHQQQIVHCLQEVIKNKQAALIFFEDLEKIQVFCNSEMWKNSHLSHQILAEHTLHKENIINKATSSEQITFCTKSFGRGTDFRCFDKTVYNRGGVLVIQTYLSESESEEIQVMGRTGRQQDPGNYKLILHSPDLMKMFDKTEEELRKLNLKKDYEVYRQLKQWRKESYEERVNQMMEEVKDAKSFHENTENFIKDLKKAMSSRSFFGHSSLLQSFSSLSLSVSPPPKCNVIPFHVFFCLDESGSMEGRPWEELVAAVLAFVNNRVSQCAKQGTQSNDLFTLTCYSSSARTLGTELNVNSDFESLLSSPQFSLTSFGAGLKESYKQMKSFYSKSSQTHTPVLLFMSDGECNGGDAEMADIYREFKDQGLQSFVVGFGSDCDQDRLTMLATQGEGKYSHGIDGGSLLQTFEVISETLSASVFSV